MNKEKNKSGQTIIKREAEFVFESGWFFELAKGRGGEKKATGQLGDKYPLKRKSGRIGVRFILSGLPIQSK